MNEGGQGAFWTSSVSGAKFLGADRGLEGRAEIECQIVKHDHTLILSLPWPST